jgi:hypothetical protein
VSWLAHAPQCSPFHLHTRGHAGYLLGGGGYDLCIRTTGHDWDHVAALATSEFVAQWRRRPVGIEDGHLVGTEDRAVGTVMARIPYRLSTGCRDGGRTCAPFCAHGSRDNKRRLQGRHVPGSAEGVTTLTTSGLEVDPHPLSPQLIMGAPGG